MRPTVTSRGPGGFSIVEFTEPAPLRSAFGGSAGLLLDFAYGFEVRESGNVARRRQWQNTAHSYEYRLLDRYYTELLVYHWQPGPDFAGPDHPHLHVSATLVAQVDSMNRREIGLDKIHLATSHVSMADLVRVLITDFGVAPQRHDWRATLDRAERELRTRIADE